MHKILHPSAAADGNIIEYMLLQPANTAPLNSKKENSAFSYK